MGCNITGNLTQILRDSSSQQIGTDKMSRAFGCPSFIVAAKITVLLSFCCLVSLLIKDTATVRTKDQSREKPHFIITVRSFPLFPQFLDTFPCLPVNDWFMGILEYRLFVPVIIYDFMYFIGLHSGLEVYKAVMINLFCNTCG
jgi:hypothetical protein